MSHHQRYKQIIDKRPPLKRGDCGINVTDYRITAHVFFTRGMPVEGVGYYWPHLVVEGDPEYKGVRFHSPLQIGDNPYVLFSPMFADIDYKLLLKRGAKFEIKEGPHTVGTGEVTFVRDKFCSQ